MGLKSFFIYNGLSLNSNLIHALYSDQLNDEIQLQ